MDWLTLALALSTNAAPAPEPDPPKAPPSWTSEIVGSTLHVRIGTNGGITAFDARWRGAWLPIFPKLDAVFLAGMDGKSPLRFVPCGIDLTSASATPAVAGAIDLPQVVQVGAAGGVVVLCSWEPGAPQGADWRPIFGRVRLTYVIEQAPHTIDVRLARDGSEPRTEALSLLGADVPSPWRPCFQDYAPGLRAACRARFAAVGVVVGQPGNDVRAKLVAGPRTAELFAFDKSLSDFARAGDGKLAKLAAPFAAVVGALAPAISTEVAVIFLAAMIGVAARAVTAKGRIDRLRRGGGGTSLATRVVVGAILGLVVYLLVARPLAERTDLALHARLWMPDANGVGSTPAVFALGAVAIVLWAVLGAKDVKSGGLRLLWLAPLSMAAPIGPASLLFPGALLGWALVDFGLRRLVK